MIKISFILPCYNVERYVQQCVESICSCSIAENEYEIICVNDCSLDGTLSILYELEKKYAILRILDLPHHSFLGRARNEGLKAARGQYVWFVDTDDTIASAGLDFALQMALDKNLDVLCFNYRKVDDDGHELQQCEVFGNEDVDCGYGFINRVFGKSIVNHMGYVWRFLYRRRYLLSNNFYFPEGVCWEDTVFVPETMLCAERIASIPNVLYNYRVNPSSISGTFSRVYPAHLIYEFAFCTGGNLVCFSKRINDAALASTFFQSAKEKYINGFIIHLCRTSKKERHLFYQIINHRRKEICALYPYMNLTSRAVLMPYLGKLLADCLSFGYKCKHTIL